MSNLISRAYISPIHPKIKGHGMKRWDELELRINQGVPFYSP